MTFMHGTPIPAKLFTWSKTGTGVAEASDLGPAGTALHQVWPDACDVGFTVQGRFGLLTFVECGRIEKEGELVAQVYRSIDARTGRVDKTAFGLTIKLYND